MRAKWHKSHAIVEPRPRWPANPVDPTRPVSSLFIIPRIFRAPERRRMRPALSARDAFARRRFRFRVSSHRRICNELCGGHAGGSADRCRAEKEINMRRCGGPGSYALRKIEREIYSRKGAKGNSEAAVANESRISSVSFVDLRSMRFAPRVMRT